MNLMHFLGEYISKHSRNIGTDVVQHLKAFAAQAHEKMTAEVGTVETEAKDVAEEVTSYVEEKMHAAESAVHELEDRLENN